MKVKVRWGNPTFTHGNELYEVPTCGNCDEPTYNEEKCPFCDSELDYSEIYTDEQIEKLF